MLCLTLKLSQNLFEIIGFFVDFIKRDLNPLYYGIWDIYENKTTATSHPSIGSLKSAIEKEWNKMFEEFILKACKSFPRHADTIIEKKNGGHIE